VSTVTMSRTWQRRLHRGRRAARIAGLAVIAVCAVLGCAAGIKMFFATAHPDDADVVAIAHRVANQRDAAGQFAADFVAAVLTTPGADDAALQGFITVPQSAPSDRPVTSAPPPAVINTPKVWSVVPAGSAGDADLYSVTVVVQQRPYASAAAARAFYRVPVAIWRFEPRAMDWPVPISDPGPGADVKAGYEHPMAPTNPVYAVVNGFISTYLTATTGLDRYVVADSWIKPIGGYHSAVITKADTDAEIPDTPAPGAQIHVRATVLAQTSQFATITFAFPLTVENNGGTWMISTIDFIPRPAGTEAAPVGTQR
jgi:hypothetical protein